MTLRTRSTALRPPRRGPIQFIPEPPGPPSRQRLNVTCTLTASTASPQVSLRSPHSPHCCWRKKKRSSRSDRRAAQREEGAISCATSPLPVPVASGSPESARGGGFSPLPLCGCVSSVCTGCCKKFRLRLLVTGGFVAALRAFSDLPGGARRVIWR